MGRYNFAAQSVHKRATQLLEAKRIPTQPPWYDVIGSIPPPNRLVRPVMQRPAKTGVKASRMFKPVKIQYQEDELRWEFYNDHPWELARPRVVLENDGKDRERWDWGLPLDLALCRPRAGARDEMGRALDKEWDVRMKVQSARPLNGESVVQRQSWLMQKAHMPEDEAYDQARKELYRHRHAKEVEVRVAREEALATGAFFGPSPLEVGMQLEDKAYEHWRAWAAKETQEFKNLQNAAYTGQELETTMPDSNEAQDRSNSLVGGGDGQAAQGGASIPQ